MLTNQVRSELWPAKRLWDFIAARKVSWTRSSASLTSRSWPMAKLKRKSPYRSNHWAGSVPRVISFTSGFAVVTPFITRYTPSQWPCHPRVVILSESLQAIIYMGYMVASFFIANVGLIFNQQDFVVAHEGQWATKRG